MNSMNNMNIKNNFNNVNGINNMNNQFAPQQNMMPPPFSRGFQPLNTAVVPQFQVNPANNNQNFGTPMMPFQNANMAPTMNKV